MNERPDPQRVAEALCRILLARYDIPPGDIHVRLKEKTGEERKEEKAVG